MGFDLYPVDLIQNKKRLTDQAASGAMPLNSNRGWSYSPTASTRRAGPANP